MLHQAETRRNSLQPAAAVGQLPTTKMQRLALPNTLVAGLEWLAFQPDRRLEDVVPVLLRTVVTRPV